MGYVVFLSNDSHTANSGLAKKIDELIAEGYDPKLDDGVGKNIAPLQAKGMLKAEVLKASGKNSQLQKYLNADW